MVHLPKSKTAARGFNGSISTNTNNNDATTPTTNFNAGPAVNIRLVQNVGTSVGGSFGNNANANANADGNTNARANATASVNATNAMRMQMQTHHTCSATPR